MFPANDKSVDVIWGPGARMSSVMLICREKGNKKMNQDKTTMGLGIWQKMAWRSVLDKSCLPPGIWKALKLQLSHFGSSVPTLGTIILMKCILRWWPHWSLFDKNAKQQWGGESCAAWKPQINGAYSQGSVKNGRVMVAILQGVGLIDSYVF